MLVSTSKLVVPIVTLIVSNWQKIFTVEINCSSDFKILQILKPSVSNFQTVFSIHDLYRYRIFVSSKSLSPKKLRQTKCLLFKFKIMKLTKTSILPNFQVPNCFFYITVYCKLYHTKIEK